MNKQEARKAIATHYEENASNFEDDFTVASSKERQVMNEMLSILQDPDSWQEHSDEGWFFADLEDVDHDLEKVLIQANENNGEIYVEYWGQKLEHGPMPKMSRRDMMSFIRTQKENANPYPNQWENGDPKTLAEYGPGEYFEIDLHVPGKYSYDIDDALCMKVEDKEDGTRIICMDFEAEGDEFVEDSTRVARSFVEGPISEERGMEGFFVLLDHRPQEAAHDILREVFKSELAWFKSRFITRTEEDYHEFVRHCQNILDYDHLWEWEDRVNTGTHDVPSAVRTRNLDWQGAGYLYGRFYFDENDKIVGLMMSVA